MAGEIESFIQNFLATYGIDLPEGNFLTFVILLVGLSVVFQIILILARSAAKFITRKTHTELDDELLGVFSTYMPLIAVFTAIFLSMAVVYPGVTYGNLTEFDIYLMLMLVVLAFLVAGVLDTIVVWYGVKIQPPKRKGISRKRIFPFVRNVLRVSIYVLFGVFILQIAGFDTTALITGLGIGGLAVALALQGTLSNFFGGVHILIDKPFQEGDYIILESGQEGVVDRIGWRTTKLLTLGKDEIVVPNAKLAESIIKNESTPKDETGVLYEIGVSYDSDIDKVIDTLKTAAKNVEKKNELMVKDTFFARLEKHGEYALKFKFGYLVYGYVNQWNVLADMNKEISKQFRKNKIDIPYPVMVVKKPEEKKK